MIHREIPEISVLMAGHQSNCDFLREALDSLVNQTFKGFEVIFVDDQCGEKALELINSYMCLLDVTVIHNDKNLGLPKSLNKGLEYCRGKYIARFDDDDVMFPSRLEKQLEYMKCMPVNVGCWSEFVAIDYNGIERWKSDISNKNFLRTFLQKGNCCCHSTLFIKKEILLELNGYNEKFTYAQDMELYFRVLEVGKMACVPEQLVKYRINDERRPVEKQLLSYFYACIPAFEYIKKHPSFRNKLLLIERTVVILKFILIDLFKL